MPASRMFRQGVVAISQTDSISSGLTSPSVRPLPQGGEQTLDRVGQIERLRIDDHELLLHPERVGGAGEPVLHGRILARRERV